VALLTVALTSTVPAACGGETSVQEVLEPQFTAEALAVPNLNVVPLAPGRTPLP